MPALTILRRTFNAKDMRLCHRVCEFRKQVSSRLGMRREPCASCGLPVYLAEKLVVAHHIYHRSCFKCARCSHQLTPGNYYETEDGQYCCEACPMDDEEIEDNEDELKQQQPHFTSYREPPDDQQEQQQQQQQQQQLNITTSSSSSSPSKAVVDLDEQDAAAVLEAPLSDEEKSKRRSLDRNVDRLLSSQKSRLDIISSHLLGDKIGELDIQETSNSSKDRVDGIDVQQERVVLLATGESDEEKTAKSRLNSVKMVEEDKAIENTTEPKILLPSSALMPDDDSDDKFDEMIKLINDRIDELTTEEKTTTDEEKLKKEEAVEEEDKKIKELASPDSRRESNVNNAPNVVEIRRASDDIKRENDFTRRLEEVRKKEKEESDQEATPALRRSSSLRDTGEHTKDQKISAEPRRLSLVQRRLKFFETEPHDNEPEPSMPGPELQPVKTEQQPVQPISPVSAKSDHSVVDSLEKNKQRESEVQKDEDYPEDLNPFASDDEHNESPVKKKPASTNPFGSSDEDEIEEVPPKPMARTRSKGAATMAREHEVPKKRVLEAPQINLNPFWSDDEEPESENEVELRNKSPPVPKPRTLRQSHMDGSLQPKSNLTSSSIHSSNTSIASSCSTITPGGTYRKKKPAPPPPLLNQSYNTPIKSPNASTNSNASLSPRLTPRTRKSKPAPPPPLPTAASTPAQQTTVTTATKPISDSDVVTGYRHSTTTLPDESVVLRHHHDNETRIESQQYVWDDEKLSKDEANRNTQSLHLPYTTDKSVEGKWKRKKGPAPPRPMPLRRKIKVMSMKDVKLELDQIEMQQQGLEKQGVRLEQIIRDKCESGTASEESSLGFDVEELVLELFSLVNEKNELFRRQAELMLLRRQQRLEEEHADIEYQVRCLITQPEATKTDFDKQREEMLIQRLVEIVERRNEIVECLEMDRRREIEEDRSIHREMDLYAARNKSDNVNMTDESRRSSKLKKGKVKEKTKEKKSKKSNKKDADKDVDETEAKLKRHSLRKWF